MFEFSIKCNAAHRVHSVRAGGHGRPAGWLTAKAPAALQACVCVAAHLHIQVALVAGLDDAPALVDASLQVCGGGCASGLGHIAACIADG